MTRSTLLWGLVMLVGSVQAAPPETPDTVQCYHTISTERYGEAGVYCRRAADAGDLEAQFKLATLYAQGWGVVPDREKSISWLRRAAVNGHTEAQYNLGAAFQFGNGVAVNLAEAVKWYQLSADSGYPRAQRNLANLYEAGAGVERSDAKAFRLHRQAASSGLAESQVMVGLMLLEGRGTEIDTAAARDWLNEAALGGNADGQYLVGSLLMAENDPAGYRWLQRAVNQGHVIAMYTLAVSLAGPDATENSLDSAILLLDRAIRAGHVESDQLKPRLVERRASLAGGGDSPGSPDDAEVARDWLFSRPIDHYALHLAADASLDEVKGLIARFGLQDKARYYAVAGRREDPYTLVYGDFERHGDAVAAATALRLRAPGLHLFVQHFGALQTRFN